MAVNPTPTTVQQNLPSPYIEGALTALSERLLPLLSTSAAINTASYAPKVAGIDQFTQAAQQQTARQAGLGSLTFDPTTGAVTQIGAGTGIAGYEPYLQQAGALGTQSQTTLGGATQYMGPQAYQQFMSPYQQQVIDTTLTEFDKQRQTALSQQQAQAVAGGAFGGAREGVQRAEYGAQTLQDRAALQAQLLQQGFGQAQQQANTAFTQQAGLASLQPTLVGQQIAGLSGLGQQQQAQQQAILDAQATAAREAAFEPYTRYGLVGQQLTGLVGGFPTQVQTFNPQQPTSPLQTALGTGLGLASIGGKVFGKGGIFG
jgi:hypothetical protein